MLKPILIFLLINFAALGIGGYVTTPGVQSSWYFELNKAPWTPPGWVFGAAWPVVMVCFSIYLGFLWQQLKAKQTLIILFLVQLIFNVGWNFIFFYFQEVLFGLIIISSLTVLICVFFAKYWSDLKGVSFLLLPYIVWLFIATSLNAYILVAN